MFSINFHTLTADAIQRVSVPLSAISSISAGAVIDSGVNYSQATQRALGLVSEPISAASKGIGLTGLQTATRFIARSAAVVTVGASAMVGAQILDQRGGGALLYSNDGRAAALGALGGSLMLVPTPATQLGAAGVLALGVANQFGAFNHFNRVQYAKPMAAHAAV